jgi:hypothetical protein
MRLWRSLVFSENPITKVDFPCEMIKDKRFPSKKMPINITFGGFQYLISELIVKSAYMDTTENTDKLKKLQMLNQEKQALEKKLSKADIWTYPLVLIFLVLPDIISEVTANRIFGALIIILLPFFGYSVVKDVKLRWSIDDIEREIKRIEKLC